MNLKTVYFTNHRNYTNPKKIKPQGIMIHDTGADNPNLKRYVQPNVYGIGENAYNNHWNKATQVECAHVFIGALDDGTIASINVMPFTYRTYHCGDSANNTHISIEICRDINDETYFNKVYKELIEVCSYICLLYGLDPSQDGVVICHAEGYQRGIASNHADVTEWFPKYGYDMNRVRTDIIKNKTGGIFMENFEEQYKEYIKTLQDNDAGEWSKEAREWAISNGLVSGSGTVETGEPNYMWESPLTREQFYQVLYRLHLQGKL